MKRFIRYNSVIIAALVCLLSPAAAQSRLPRQVSDSICATLRRITLNEVAGSYVKIESTRIIEKGKSRTVEVRTSVELAYYPMRPESVNRIYAEVRNQLPSKYRNYTLLIYSSGRLIDDLIPHHYRKVEGSRSFKHSVEQPLITRLSSISQPSKGLLTRHIALWQSHGRYFNQNTNMWSWQRPRLWETVEDLYTQGYVLPYLVPMLERAGASVFLPRERSVQRFELIADNDKGIDDSHYKEHNGTKHWQSGSSGFAHHYESYASGENPFDDGTVRMVEAVKADDSKPSTAHWGGKIDKAGIYSVYISYATTKKSVPDARYTVHASGGDREFVVNQRMGDRMWVCLGDFYFEEGNHAKLVSLSNISDHKGIVTADAIKIGGGMGNIRRSVCSELRVEGEEYEETTSGYPRFTEGARYWLQWSGFSTDVYAGKDGKDDYKEDYMSRAHWVNALMGGSERLKGEAGKSIPVDLAFAFHSDAGVRLNDDVIGTLGIYSTKENKARFEGGASRLRSRDLTDLIMTQIVDDIRAKYEPNWVRRGMWDRAYYEARMPACPTMLLELLSHQNFADMRYGLDPSFRFDVCRAVYKGMLKYIASQYGYDYVVQPLPVNSFAVELCGNEALLSWQATNDPLEPTAAPDYYILYTRVDDGGFDCGKRIDTNYAVVAQETGRIYSYRVTAVNEGGESFDSETLSAYVDKHSKGTVMIVNGFDRVAAPYSIQGEQMAGFLNNYDSGVAHIADISFIGEQVVFDRALSKSESETNALGTSYSDYETRIVAGNTFDYPALHGKAIAKSGYSFASAAHKAVSEGHITLEDYAIVDLILGKQRTTAIGRGTSGYHFEVLNDELQTALRRYTEAGGALMLSGCYILDDLWHSPTATEQDQAFAKEVLHTSFGGAMASRNGEVYAPSTKFTRKRQNITFSTTPNEDIYPIESPEVVMPAGKGAFTILRYEHSQASAAVAYDGENRVIQLGFPFETIEGEAEREKLMAAILKYLTEKREK